MELCTWIYTTPTAHQYNLTLLGSVTDTQLASQPQHCKVLWLQRGCSSTFRRLAAMLTALPHSTLTNDHRAARNR